MLNFIYYPVSAIMWFWHKVFEFVLPQGFAWTLAVVFLVFTLRAVLYKPFVHQVRSMRKMQEFAPEIQKLKKKYGNDKQKMATEMQKLQGEHGVNPLGGCLPVVVQIPVFIGLFHVLKGFQPGFPYNYVFDKAGVESFNAASLFGAKLGAALHPYAGGARLETYNTTLSQQLTVMIPLAIAAAVFTHITARHSIARQTDAQAANPQAAVMNKLMLWLFPVGAIAGSPFLPLAILVYWVSNNLWTLAQQQIVYKKIDAEEAERKTRKIEVQRSLAPKVGQKPKPDAKQKKPGAKPIAPRESQNGTGKPAGETPGDKTTGAKPNRANPSSRSGSNGSNAASGASSGSERGRSGGPSGNGGVGGTAKPPGKPPVKRGRKK